MIIKRKHICNSIVLTSASGLVVTSIVHIIKLFYNYNIQYFFLNLVTTTIRVYAVRSYAQAVDIRAQSLIFYFESKIINTKENNIRPF